MNKNKISRRDFLLYSTATLSGLALAACQPAPTEEATEAEADKTTVEAEEPTVEAEAPPAEIVELRQLWRIMSPVEESTMNAMLDAFEELNPTIKVSERVFAPYPEFEDKANVWLASGTPMAIWGPVAIRYYEARDLCYQLDEFMERDGIDTSDFYETSLSLCQWEGHWYGLPALNGPTLMIYNKDLFDEAGLDYPTYDWDDESWNWDAWLEMAQKLTKFDEDGKPTQYALASWGDSRMVLNHFGVDWFGEEIIETGWPTKAVPDREGVIEVLQLLQDMMFKYKCAPTIAEGQSLRAASPNLFQTGVMATAFTNVSAFVSNRTIIDFEWGVCPIPHPVGRPRYNYMYPDQWFIVKPQEHLEAVWELFKFATSTDGGKYYPIQLGWLSGRKSLDDYYKEYVLNIDSERHVYTEEEVQVALDANAFQVPPWSHSLVEAGPLGFQVVIPNKDLLMIGDVTPEECVDNVQQTMTPEYIDEIRHQAPEG